MHNKQHSTHVGGALTVLIKSTIYNTVQNLNVPVLYSKLIDILIRVRVHNVILVHPYILANRGHYYEIPRLV